MLFSAGMAPGRSGAKPPGPLPAPSHTDAPGSRRRSPRCLPAHGGRALEWLRPRLPRGGPGPGHGCLLSERLFSPSPRGELPGCGRDLVVVSSSLKILCALCLGRGCRQQRCPHGGRVWADLLRGQLREEAEPIVRLLPQMSCQ